VSGTTTVALQCESAESTSRTPGGRGQEIRFEVVTGIRVPGSRLAAFRHREYPDVRITGRRPQERSYPFSVAMAQRLLGFARTCFVQGAEGYDGYDFMYYMVGAISSPTSTDRPDLEGKAIKAANMMLGDPYLITDANHMPIHPFIGLGPGAALDVSGTNGLLNVCMADRLVRAYGGTHVRRITHIA
jgi:hypothetical protein